MTDTGETRAAGDRSPAAPAVKEPTLAADSVRGVCPYLAAAGGGWRSVYPTRDHRCTATVPPVAVAVAKQRDLCLRPAHVSCATFAAARELEAAAPPVPMEEGGLWPPTRGTVMALESAKPGPVEMAGARGRGQALLVGLMVLAFAVLVIARTTPPSSGPGTSPAPTASTVVSPAASVAGSLAGDSPSPVPTPSAPAGTPSSSPARTASPTAEPTTAPTAGPPAPSATHTVKRGETLSSIAATYGTTVKQLKRANGLTSSLIRVGQVLIIP